MIYHQTFNVPLLSFAGNLASDDQIVALSYGKNKAKPTGLKCVFYREGIVCPPITSGLTFQMALVHQFGASDGVPIT